MLTYALLVLIKELDNYIIVRLKVIVKIKIILGCALNILGNLFDNIWVGLIKTVFIMIFTPFVAKRVGITSPRTAMIFGGLVGSTSGVSTGLAAYDPELVPYGTMVATFYSGFGCLLCPSVLYGLTKLIFPA